MKTLVLLLFVLFSRIASANVEPRVAIEQSTQEANQAFFASHQMQLKPLKNCPYAISTIVNWVYDEWHTFDAALTKEKLYSSYGKRINDDRIPGTFVVLKENLPIGVVSLKLETAPEFSDFPEGALWLGTLYVTPGERAQGVEEELLTFAMHVTEQLGYNQLYCYISNPDYVDWYLGKGAKLLETRPFRQHTIAIMALPLKLG